MRLDTLHEFVIVAKHLNITKAAQELYTTQPSLSGRISALEKELGYPVLDRSRNRIALTPAGTVLLDYAQRILALHDEALEKSKAAADLTPRVRVAAISPESPFLGLLPDYGDAPYCFIDLDKNVTAIDAVLEGLVDVAIESDYSVVEDLKVEGDALGIAYLGIGSNTCFLALMASHPLAHKERLARSDLTGQTVVINSGLHFDRWSKMVQTLVGEDVKLGFRMNTLESMSNMSFVDLGTSLYICADASSRALLSQRADVRVFEQLDGKPISLPSALVCRTEDLSDEGSPVRRFVDELARRRSET